MRRALVLLLFLVLLTPTVAAAPWFGTTVRTELVRVGDVFVFETIEAPRVLTFPSPNTPVRHTYTVVVEGPTLTHDEFGLPREATGYLIQDERDDGSVRLQRCHTLLGGLTTVRRDLLGGYPSEQTEVPVTNLAGIPSGSLQRQQSRNLTPLVSYSPNLCVGVDHLGAVRLREGERALFLEIARVVPSWSGRDAFARSQPSVAITFHGRDALAFTFDLEDLGYASVGAQGTLTLVVAAGLPGIVRLTLDARNENGEAITWLSESRELVAYRRGDGPAVPADKGVIPPFSNPFAARAPLDALAVDDGAYGLLRPYADAWAGARADPTTQINEYLANNPESKVWFAMFEEGWEPYGAPASEGSWFAGVAGHSDGYAFTSSKNARLDGPVVIALPVPTTVHTAFDLSFGRQGEWPDDVITSRAAMDLAAHAGIEPGTVRAFSWGAAPAQDGIRARAVVVLSDVSLFASGDDPREGTTVTIDLVTGGLMSIYSTDTTSRNVPLLESPVDGGDIASSRAAAPFLDGPAPGVGLASGAVALLAIVALLAKVVLVPLYTRLRRTRILDQPVRARLYDHILAQPGLHRQELIDRAGVGDGATRHHLNHLLAHNLIVAFDEGGFVRYYIPGRVPVAQARRAAILRSDSTRRVYELLANEPALSLREAGARLGMSAPSVHRIKKKLEGEGLLPAANGVVNLRAEA